MTAHLRKNLTLFYQIIRRKILLTVHLSILGATKIILFLRQGLTNMNPALYCCVIHIRVLKCIYNIFKLLEGESNSGTISTVVYSAFFFTISGVKLGVGS